MNLAIVDIESTGLKGDRGFVLCAGIKPLGQPGYAIGLHTEGFGPDRYGRDRKVVAKLREHMLKYDGWITWNGLLYDLPYINDRLTINNYPLLEKRFARGLDMMWHAKLGKSTFTSARLDWVAKALKCPFHKTILDWIPTWQEAEEEAAHRFNQGRLYYNEVVSHCLADLDVTEWVYNKLKPRIQNISKW